jgi:RHS repeat-associated protein
MSQFHPPYYSPFGSSLPNRTWSDANRGFRFGFNGKEKDSETASDNYDFGARIYDGRLGRWLSLDPLMKKYPDQSAYLFCLNSVLMFKDVDGRDVIITVNVKTNPPANCVQDIGNTGLKNDEIILKLNNSTGMYDLIFNIEVGYASNLVDLEKINPGITIFAKVHEEVHVARCSSVALNSYGTTSSFLISKFGFTEAFSGTADEVMNKFNLKGQSLVNESISKNNLKLDQEYSQRIEAARSSGNFIEVTRLTKERNDQKIAFSENLKRELQSEAESLIIKLKNYLAEDIKDANNHFDYLDANDIKRTGVNNETKEKLRLQGEYDALYIQDDTNPINMQMKNIKGETIIQEMPNCNE